ncbi:hypothetical protein [Stenotrophomonas sp. GD03657]|uniref:hypothetical protein n=1 Tax=Stenotrophomonas sp. GD03657 TaxID=2975363 RepID=UPI0024499FFE|nr:hypothetical protein [Stenotrophomonas sp. GD03657]MDH2154131.1 hypothetical protein [Stenotrophomonas sp. GD03657]
MRDHHIPLATFRKQYEVPGYPVDVEAMLTKAGVKIVNYVGQSFNGAELVEKDNDLVMRISTGRRYAMSSANRRVYVARAFGLFLSEQPGSSWKVTDADMGATHNDPHDVFSHRFTGELLVPEGELRSFLKPLMPCVERVAWVKACAHFDVPMMYVVQRISALKFKLSQKP